MSEDYFYLQFKECPHCHSEKITIETFSFLGAHSYASLKCGDCEKEWSTSNDQKIDWQIPEKGKEQ